MSRAISDLGYAVFDDVLYTIGLFHSRYGANGYHDSGHTKTTPTWIYDFPRYGGAQVGIRMNNASLTLYVRDKTRSGSLLSDVLPRENIKKSYPRDGKPAGSVERSVYLKPSSSSPLLQINLARDNVQRVLDAYFDMQSAENVEAAEVKVIEPVDNFPHRYRINGVITAEEYENQLNRKSEIGKAGELIAVLDEFERLRTIGCPEPKKYVNRVALTDVGRGYDIESLWPGEERYIEVKSSTSLDSDFYISDNERKILTSLGASAWLYRVHVHEREGDLGVVTKRIQNPMSLISEEDMSPVVWRVNAVALS